MKKLSFIIFLFIFTSSASAQCTPTVGCTEFAQAGSFKILNNPGEKGSDASVVQGNNEAKMTCDLLCQIEQNRKEHDDVKIWIDGLWILIYAKDGSTIKPVEENE